MLFIDVPYLRAEISGWKLSSKINYEFITENRRSTFLLGFVPITKYSIEVNGLSFFVQGGVGANYIYHHIIGSRNLGRHFIFSDMIGLGVNLFKSKNYQVALSYVFRHISNAGLFRDNEGYNSQYLLFTFTI